MLNAKVTIFFVTLLLLGSLVGNAHAEPTAPELTESDGQAAENYKVLRGFLKGAGYSAASEQLICNTGGDGIERCVPSTDVRGYIVDIIRFVLSIVGFLFFGLLVYSGYLWTTAGGNDEAVKKAKAIAVKAVTGFIIVLAAYSITSFVTGFLQSSTAPQTTIPR